MIKQILLCIGIFMAIPSYAQTSGFASSTDLRLSYKDKVFSTSLGYDLGYKFKDMIYLGAGPMVGFSTGNSISAFSGGGYGKLRFTVPIRSEIKPFIQGNCGYTYNFKSEKGDMFYGGAAGLKFKNVVVGVYCDIATNTTTITSTSSSWQTISKRRDFTGKNNSGAPSGKWVTSTKTDEIYLATGRLSLDHG